MSNQRNAYLKAMGIDVWLERSPVISDAINFEVDSVLPTTKKYDNQNDEPVVDIDVIAPIPEKKSEIVPESNEENPAESKTNIETLDWQALSTVVAQCQLCELSQTRTQTVFGAGKKTASLMIIGDAPTEEDEQHGSPFIGQAGKLLTAMLKAIGYQRNDVYISNIVKCRTKDNQEPSVDTATSCESYLKRQIDLLQPKLILALGSVTAQRLLKSKSSMGRLRGQLHYIEGVNAPIIVSYHPAYLLRAPNEKRKAWEDLQMAMKELSQINGLDSGKEHKE